MIRAADAKLDFFPPERAINGVAVQRVVERCGRCGWSTGMLPLGEARQAFAAHECGERTGGLTVVERNPGV